MSLKSQRLQVALVCAVLLTTPSYAGSCPEYRPNAKAAVVGGVVGTGVGVATAVVVAGAVVKVSVTATSGGALAVAVATDCATTGCLLTILSGAALGIWAAIEFFTGERDCAGALVLTHGNEWWRHWDRDSLVELTEDLEDRYGKDLGRARLVAMFRHCAAAAVSGQNVVVGEAKTLSRARREALQACRRKLGACRIAAAQCNAG